MSERFETKRCMKALYKYSSFPFLFYFIALNVFLLQCVVIVRRSWMFRRAARHKYHTGID